MGDGVLQANQPNPCACRVTCHLGCAQATLNYPRAHRLETYRSQHAPRRQFQLTAPDVAPPVTCLAQVAIDGGPAIGHGSFKTVHRATLTLGKCFRAAALSCAARSPPRRLCRPCAVCRVPCAPTRAGRAGGRSLLPSTASDVLDAADASQGQTKRPWSQLSRSARATWGLKPRYVRDACVLRLLGRGTRVGRRPLRDNPHATASRRSARRSCSSSAGTRAWCGSTARTWTRRKASRCELFARARHPSLLLAGARLLLCTGRWHCGAVGVHRRNCAHRTAVLVLTPGLLGAARAPGAGAHHRVCASGVIG